MGAILEQITLGNVIEIGAITVGWIVTIVKIDSRLKSVEQQIKDVTSLTRWRERMEERMVILRRDVDDLRRGRGWVQPDVDGEYLKHAKVREGGEEET